MLAGLPSFRSTLSRLVLLCAVPGLGVLTGFASLPSGDSEDAPTVALTIDATSFTLSSAPYATVQVGCNSACGQVDYQIDGVEWGTGR